MAPSDAQTGQHPYPVTWESVAELRVFRTTPEKWQRLISWRTEMRRLGWKLLQVSQVGAELVVVFGRTRAELLARQERSR